MNSIRSHARLALAGAVVLVAVVAGGVAYAVTSPGGSSTAAAAPSVTTTAPPTSAPAPVAHKHKSGAGGVKGTIVTLSPTSWTIRSAKTGTTYTVTITPTTKYGTAKAAETASSFAVGQTVQVKGALSGATISATQVRTVTAKTATTTPTSTPATTGS